MYPSKVEVLRIFQDDGSFFGGISLSRLFFVQFQPLLRMVK